MIRGMITKSNKFLLKYLKFNLIPIIEPIGIKGYTFSVEYLIYVCDLEKCEKSHKNDIAIIRLSRKVHFNVFIQPICLPSPTLKYPTNDDFKCFVSGWGYRDLESGKHSSILQDIHIPLVDDQKCKETYKDKARL